MALVPYPKRIGNMHMYRYRKVGDMPAEPTIVIGSWVNCLSTLPLFFIAIMSGYLFVSGLIFM